MRRHRAEQQIDHLGGSAVDPGSERGARTKGRRELLQPLIKGNMIGEHSAGRGGRVGCALGEVSAHAAIVVATLKHVRRYDDAAEG